MLKAAVTTINVPTSRSGQIAVAIAALAEGVRQRLPLPNGTAVALWSALSRSPDAAWSSAGSEAVGEIATADVVAAILDALRTPGCGVSLAEVALDALAGPAAAEHLTDHDLADIAERAGGRLIHGAARAIQAVCEHRTVAQHTVTQIADAWSERGRPARLAALDLIDLLPNDIARKLVERALGDAHCSVRSMAAMKVSDALEPDNGLALVRHRITVEADVAVIADLLRAEADLIVLLAGS